MPVERSLPQACKQLPPLTLQSGTSVRDVLEKQHAQILILEKQIGACAGSAE